jgi:hypothetical protein
MAATDRFGLDIWLEGPSGSEPEGHMSINAGDPYGPYVSRSFGIGPGCWTGCVYDDVERGGRILVYFKTTPSQTLEAISALDAAAVEDSRAVYGLDATCRTYSQDKFEELASKHQNASWMPPQRPIAPRLLLRTILAPSWSPSATTSTTETSTSR